MNSINAVILAGGTASEEIRALTGVNNRALIPLAGRPMIDYVVDALAGSTSIEKILVVGNVPESGRYDVVPDQGSLFDNLVAGLRAATPLPQPLSPPGKGASSEYALVSTSDIPFLTSAAVDDFVRQASERAVDIAYPIVEMGAYRGRFGDMKRTTVKLREGEFTGGNLMLLRTEFIIGQPERIKAAYAARKDIFKLGLLLGPNVLFRLIVSQTLAPSMLSLPAVEAAAARVLGPGSTVAAVATSYPEIGTDVDKPADIDAAERILSAAIPSGR